MAHTWTWDKLAKNAYRLNPKSRGQQYPYVPKWEYMNYTSGMNKGQKIIVPFAGTNSVLFSLKAWGVTQSSLHNVTLLFSDVDILTENPMSSRYFQVEYDGKMYWIEKIDRFKNPLTSRCTCKDFFYTFSYYNSKMGHCLYGPPPRPYQRKTNNPNLIRNKLGICGICKHIYHSWQLLKNTGLTIN